MNRNSAWNMLRRKLLTTWLPVGVIALTMAIVIR